MTPRHFVTRSSCPACAETSAGTLMACAFLSGDVGSYLRRHYPTAHAEMERYLAGAEYVLMDCQACGLVYQRDVPGEEFLAAIYSGWLSSDRNKAQRKFHNLGWALGAAEELSQVVVALKQTPPSMRVLDFGMGWGQWATVAAAIGCQSFGTELAIERLEYARSRGVIVLNYADIPAHEFDFINTEQVFEHLSDPRGVLKHLSHGLARGGVLKISVPTARNIRERLRRPNWAAPKGTATTLNAVAPLEHLNCFTRRSLRIMASQAGLVEFHVPVAVQYRYGAIAQAARGDWRALLRPVVRRWTDRENYVFFTKVR